MAPVDENMEPEEEIPVAVDHISLEPEEAAVDSDACEANSAIEEPIAKAAEVAEVLQPGPSEFLPDGDKCDPVDAAGEMCVAAALVDNSADEAFQATERCAASVPECTAVSKDRSPDESNEEGLVKVSADAPLDEGSDRVDLCVADESEHSADVEHAVAQQASLRGDRSMAELRGRLRVALQEAVASQVLCSAIDQACDVATCDQNSDAPSNASECEAFWCAVPLDDFKAQPNWTLDKSSAAQSIEEPRINGKSVTSQAAYPEACAQFFGEVYAHRLRWSHAVNSKRKLRVALATTAQFLEADVACGPLVVREEASGGRKPSSSVSSPHTSVCTEAGAPVIMAHYPTELSSDLSLEAFIEAVLAHNERLAAKNAKRAHSKSTSSSNSTAQKDCDEAVAFVKHLDRELDQAAAQSSTLASCVGSRRHQSQFASSVSTMKGVKLDFKRFECVKPAIAYLRKVDAAKRLEGHLWLNADVFAGPGALMSPMDARDFVTLCAETLPEAVLSLSWGSSLLSATRAYTPDMVGRMVELCMTPIVPGSMAEGRPAAGVSNGNGSEMHFTPAAVCRHITFAIAAEYALRSAEGLCRLLDCVPGTSVTIFSGAGSFSTTPEHVGELVKRYGTRRLFLDVKLSKAWRSCGTSTGCSLQ